VCHIRRAYEIQTGGNVDISIKGRIVITSEDFLERDVRNER